MGPMVDLVQLVLAFSASYLYDLPIMTARAEVVGQPLKFFSMTALAAMHLA